MKKFVILLIVALAAVAIVAKKKASREPAEGASGPATSVQAQLPRLLDLGSKGCTACAALEPVLAQLRTQYAGSLQVDFVDVREVDGAAEKYDIDIIPVQIFYNARGEELARNQGFISASNIVATFAQHGVTLSDH